MNASKADDRSDHDFDALVIGSGFAGAVTACRLVEAGLRVCIIERGRRFGPEDLPVVPIHDDEAPSDFTRFGWTPARGLWDFRDLGDLAVGQAAGFGGGSLIYANVHLRAPADAFEAWPASINADVLSPYYDLAAYMLQVSTAPNALKIRKRSAFEDATKGMGQAFETPLAVNFDESLEHNPISGRQQGACDLRGECLLGCGAQAKNTLDLNYLALAEDGGATVRTLCEVVDITATRNGYDLECLDHLSGEDARIRLRGRYVFLCAGAVNTTELLMRSQSLGSLEIKGDRLGKGYFANADDVAVVFETDANHEMDRGPTITSAVVHERDGQWMMLQDGGLPTEFMPWLGAFRSPLLLSRNRFHEQPTGKGLDREGHGFADLPAASEAISALSELLQDPAKADGKGWSILPDQLHHTLDEIRLQALAELSAALEPTVASAMQSSATDSDLAERIEALQTDQSSAQRYDDLPAMAIELAIRMAFGSQSGMAQFLATELIDRFVPWGDRLQDQVIEFLARLLDYRYLDSHTSLLLAMGRDTQPGTLSLAWADVIPKGAQIRGGFSGATALVLADSAGNAAGRSLLVSPIRGRIEPGEPLTSDGRDLGRCREIAARPTQPIDFGGLALECLRLRVDDFDTQPGRQRAAKLRRSRLTLELPPIATSPERSLSERMMRDFARTSGGELRTNPLYSAFGKRVSVHNQGGCAMSEDPKGGVCRPDGGVHGCEGLYVMDAAAFAAPVGVNPSATILAIAEWKCERFIHEVLGQSDWAPTQKPAARRWADARRPMLDPLAKDHAPATPVDPIRSEPVGIGFHERMIGTLDAPSDYLDGVSRNATASTQTPIVLELDVAIEDLEALVSAHRTRDPIHAVVRGEVRLGDAQVEASGTAATAETGATDLPDTERILRIDESKSRLGLFMDPDPTGVGPPYRSLGYWLELEEPSTDGAPQRFLLAGRKRALAGSEGEVWSELSTLPFELTRVGDPASRRFGLVRLPAAVFVGEQLKEMRATGTEDGTRRTWAMLAFARFFMGEVVDLYGPRLGAAPEWIERAFGARS